FADDVPAEAAPVKTRRFSLRQRVLVTTLAPLVVASLGLLGGAYLALKQAQQTVIREGAQSLAASVGTSVNIDDVNALDTQLRTLLKQPTVGFIAVNTPDGLQFFRSKNEDADFLLGETVNAWIAKNPGASSFVNSDQPADRFKLQLEQLKDSGVSDPKLLEGVQAKIDDPANRKTTVTHYEVQNIGVYEKNGVRTAGAATAAKGAEQPRFTVAVGVVSDSSVAATRRSTLMLFGLTLVILVSAAFFAIRTGRRIVQPIETLVAAADKISLGQLDTPVSAERNDEIGDLARALERMRLSLEAAMERLRKRRNR
ncbi:HAMP domain-containing protein, partial [Deinococcus pimensis]|uniref:HAMP domain-containing protein n=1 Tax=Deinococcus pimensis TaxID=309888 RepID=UPI0005EBC50A